MDFSVEISRIEGLLGRYLTDEEKQQATFWRRGRALSEGQNSPAAQILLEMLQDYVDEAQGKLSGFEYPEDAALRAAHSLAFTANNFYQRLLSDVQRAIDTTNETPEFIKKAFSRVSPIEES